MSNLVLFDELCGLCDGIVQWLLKADAKKRLLFAPLQGETADRIFARHPQSSRPDSVVFVRDFESPGERLFFQSDAAVQIFAAIGWPWILFTALRLFPAFFRNGVYQWVAEHRNRWFGRLPACRIPSPEVRARFLP